MSGSLSAPGKRSSLLYNWGKDLQVWAFISLTLTLFRAILITTFHQQSDSITLGNLLTVLGTGFRYDIAVAAVWVLPTVVLSLLLPLLKQEAILQKICRWLLLVYKILGEAAGEAFTRNIWSNSSQSEQARANIARTFQDAVIDTLTIKCKRTMEQTSYGTLVLAGGVSTIKGLRKRLSQIAEQQGFELIYSRPEFCTGNGRWSPLPAI